MAAFMLLAGTAQAVEIETGSDLKVRWDNTVKYSTAYRTKDPAANTIGAENANGDDGNLNFRRGLVSSRVDLLTDLDFSYKDLGARVSGAAWYDSLYRRPNRNDSPSTANAVPHNAFTPATAKLHGRRGELLDAFVFGQGDLGDGKLASFRLGRHALLYGESLFFGANGIAGTQGPVDVIKAQQVRSSQVKEIIRPVNQLSGQVQLRTDLSVGGYYQFEWSKNRLSAAGSYLSASDFLDDGGERLLVGPPLVAGGGRQALVRGADMAASDSGQFGGQMHWRPSSIDGEFGLYFTRSHARNPIVHARPAVVEGMGVVNPSEFDPLTGQVGSYSLVYHEGIKTFGVSASTAVGELNIAAEASVRRDTPLVVSAVGVVPGETITNHGHTLYPVGNSAHLQVSAVYALPRTAAWGSAMLTAEIAWNRRLSVNQNADLVDPNSTRDASALRFVFEPTYYQLVSGLDLSVPIGAGYGLSGRSSTVSQFSVEHGGDLSIGVNAEYLKVWKLGLSYTRFLGAARPLTVPSDVTPTGLAYSLGQTLADRNFIAFSVQRTF